MPRVIDHEERRKHIIAVARDLMVEGGFAAATMRGIATSAGFANGALKHYFDGKDAIVAATFDSVLAEMAKYMPAAGGSPDVDPVDELHSYVLAAMPVDETRIGGARVLLALWENSVTNPDLAERYRQHLLGWGKDLHARIRAAAPPGTSDETIEGLVHEVITVTIGANVACLLSPAEEIIERYTRYTDSFVERVKG